MIEELPQAVGVERPVEFAAAADVPQDGNAHSVAILQIVIAEDIDLLEHRSAMVQCRFHDLACDIAQVATESAVQYESIRHNQMSPVLLSARQHPERLKSYRMLEYAISYTMRVTLKSPIQSLPCGPIQDL